MGTSTRFAPGMIQFAGRRLVTLPLVLLGISAAVFVCVRLVPGDPALVIAGLQASEAELVEIRAKLGLDKPFPAQFAIWLSQVVRGDLGVSLITNTPVLDLIKVRYVLTFQVAAASTVLATLLGVVSGVFAASRRYSAIDGVITIVSLLGVSVPAFWLGVMLMLVFALYLNWLPAGGADSILHLVLPTVALGAYSWGIIARMTRASMLEVLNQDYIRTAQAKGLAQHPVLFRHALKNATLPVITVIGIQFGTLLAGAVVTESVFGLPGLGALLVSSIFQRDFPVIQGAVLAIATSFVLINLFVDLTYAWVDPRIHY